jgi:hypothetical protein
MIASTLNTSKARGYYHANWNKNDTKTNRNRLTPQVRHIFRPLRFTRPNKFFAEK